MRLARWVSGWRLRGCCAPGVIAVALVFAASARAQPGDEANEVGRGAGATQHDGSGDGAPPAVRMPVLLQYAEPVYPEDAARRGLTATVELELELDSAGKVTGARVVEPVGHGFDEAAVAAALRLEFQPAIKDGQPVAARILFRYEFELRKEPTPPVGAVKAAELSGRVTLPDATEGFAGASVELRRGGRLVAVALTAADGSFAFDSVPAADYELRITAPGYAPITTRVHLRAGFEASADYELEPAQGEGAHEITVRGQRKPRDITYRQLERSELSRVPGTRGDALRALENLPGVARPPTLSGLLIVRGTSVESTQIFVDGTFVPNMYHFGGLSSVVPTEMLDRVDFYTGNYSVRYGRGTGGIVDIAIRRARKDGRYHGLAQLDLLDARAMLEGPVPFSDHWRFLAGARRSHVDAWLIPLLEDQDTSFQAAPVYYDYQAFAETNPDRDSYLRFGIFGSDDRIRLTNTASASAGELDQADAFWNVQALHEGVIDAGVRTRTVVSFGFFLQRININTVRADSKAYPLVLRNEVSFDLSEQIALHVGPDLLYAPIQTELAVPEELGPNSPDPGSVLLRPQRLIKDGVAFFRPGAYAELEVEATPRWRLTPGIRFDYAHDTGRVDVSPRINSKYDLVQSPRRTSLKGGFGFFHEPPAIRETLDGYGNDDLRSVRALQTSLGVEQELGEQVTGTLEGFHIDLDDEITRRPDETGRLEYQNTASGSVIGAELLLRYEPDERFFGWLSYTLSRSRRVWGPNEPEVFFDFDQTHVLAAVGSYHLGRGWQFGARFRYVTGNPLTPCIAGLYSSAESNYVCVNGPFQSDRADAFYQLDLRLEKRWRLSQDAAITAYVELINATNREGRDRRVYNFDYSESDFVSANLPMLPNLGVQGEF